jgi:phosphomethylpyrimidine synthase
MINDRLIRNKQRSIRGVSLLTSSAQFIVIVGATNSSQSISDEIRKAQHAEKFGASVIGDVSTGSGIPNILQSLLKEIPLPISTVPLYQIFHEAKRQGCWNKHLSKNLVLDCITEQAELGIDCMTIHAGFKRDALAMVQRSARRIKVQARGGGLLFDLMRSSGLENPLYEYFDDILSVAEKHGVTISLGNSLRTGTVDDPIDELVHAETGVFSELTLRAVSREVSIMVEGLSHIPFEMISPYVRWVKSVCNGAPLRLLGPLGTEKGLGYDHITAAICQREAINSGVDFITCVTRAEHIGIPNEEEIREALISARVARELAVHRANNAIHNSRFACGLGFENLTSDDVFDLEKAVQLKIEKNSGNINACSMCNETCRMKLNPRRLTVLPLYNAEGKLMSEDPNHLH